MRDALKGVLDKVLLSPTQLGGLSEIDRFAGGWSVRPLYSATRLDRLVTETGQDAARAALRYDGVVPQSASITSGFGHHALAEQFASNYEAAIHWIANEGMRLSLSEALIGDLHQRLFKGIKSSTAFEGRYRTRAHADRLPANIALQAGVVPADAIPAAMATLVSWYRKREELNDCHPLYPVAVFIVQWILMCPFAAGNGRMALLLFRYLLLRAGYSFVPFTTIEVLCLENQFPDFGAAADSTNAELTKWTKTFSSLIDILLQAVVGLQVLAETEDQASNILPALSNQILDVVERLSRAQLNEIVTQTGANRNTVKAHLRQLVALKLLVRHGGGRATWYART